MFFQRLSNFINKIKYNVNGGDIDIDFSKYSVEEFLREIMKLKN